MRTCPALEPAARDILDAIDIPAALLDFRQKVIRVDQAARTSAADEGAPGSTWSSVSTRRPPRVPVPKFAGKAAGLRIHDTRSRT